MSEPQTITRLLRAWRQGDRDALHRLTQLVYDELHRLAERAMRGERADHTLQPTALVHEAYVRLVEANVDWQDRVHFMATAATTMRRILVDHARSKKRIKRGGGATKLPLEEVVLVSAEPREDLLLLDEALDRLARQDERKARVIELKYFGGLSYEETATALEISAATVDRELRMAKAWLYRELDEGER